MQNQLNISSIQTNSMQCKADYFNVLAEISNCFCFVHHQGHPTGYEKGTEKVHVVQFSPAKQAQSPKPPATTSMISMESFPESPSKPLNNNFLSPLSPTSPFRFISLIQTKPRMNSRKARVNIC